MTLSSVSIQGYRSVRKLYLPLRQLTVLVGGNGVGKTNLYRSIELLHAAANNTIAAEIAREGGLASIFWAGGKNLAPDGSFDPKYRTDGYRAGEGNKLILEAQLELDDFRPSYRIELGFAGIDEAAFSGEAQIRHELVESRDGKRSVRLMERTNQALWARGADGQREVLDQHILASETALATIRVGHPEISIVRQEFASWRFFHGFRTDVDAPLRQRTRAITSIREITGINERDAVVSNEVYKPGPNRKAVPGSGWQAETAEALIDAGLDEDVLARAARAGWSL